MHAGVAFLHDLAIVLCTAAITTVLFQRLKLPVVLGYVLAGMLVGPHIPIPLIASGDTISTLAELGVVLLLFSLGLEFSLRKLLRLGPSASLIAVIETSVTAWLGYSAARLFGWTPTDAIFTGAAVAISSTTIIAKAFDEQGVARELRSLVFGVLVVEDLLAILLLAGLTTAGGGGASALELATTVGRLVAFLVGLVVVGVLVVPRTMRAVVRLGRSETTLVASIGLCFACALLAQAFGYPLALGAFLAGSLVSDSGEVAKIEPLVEPVRDMFAAMFFVAVGMSIDPHMLAEHWVVIVLLSAVVVVGKFGGVTLGAFLSGRSIRTSVQAGMSMAQIGEFSFLIAGLGRTLGATGEFLYPVIVAVSALTTLTTPWTIRASQSAARWLDRRAPRSLVTFETLYATWLEGLKPAHRGRRAWTANARTAAWIAVDASVIVGIVIGASLMQPRLAELVAGAIAIQLELARWLVVIGAALACAPFAAGIAMQARRLARTWASDVFQSERRGVTDLAAAPRRTLELTLQIAIVIACGLPVLLVIQPFVPTLPGAGAALLALVILAAVFWRRLVDLEGHVRAGAQVVAEAMSRQPRSNAAPDLAVVSALMPGLGHLTPVQIGEDAPANGRTLRELDLHARTGATVVCIARKGAVVAPDIDQIVQAGDWIALTGSDAAVEAARGLLITSREPG